MTPNRSPSDPSSTTAPTSLHTRYAPDMAALARETQIKDADVLAVIDVRGGRAYLASVDTGLANRFPFLTPGDRQRAIEHALKTRVIVMTPMGSLRRPPTGDE